MRYRPPKTRFERWVHRTCIITLMFISYFAENKNLTSASSFQASNKKSYTRRLPANMTQQTFEFDCAKASALSEMSTQHETIRLMTKNCSQKPELQDLRFQQKLMTFQASNNQYSSEYAYLSSGENNFVVSVGNKTYKVLIIRY